MTKLNEYIEIHINKIDSYNHDFYYDCRVIFDSRNIYSFNLNYSFLNEFYYHDNEAIEQIRYNLNEATNIIFNNFGKPFNNFGESFKYNDIRKILFNKFEYILLLPNNKILDIIGKEKKIAGRYFNLSEFLVYFFIRYITSFSEQSIEMIEIRNQAIIDSYIIRQKTIDIIKRKNNYIKRYGSFIEKSGVYLKEKLGLN